MITAIRWDTNLDLSRVDTIPVLSRTLGKYALISRDYKGEVPRGNEWWYVRVDRENFAKDRPAGSGCFIVDPVSKIDTVENKIYHLMPGMYTTIVEDGLIIARPNHSLDRPWAFQRRMAKNVMDQHKAYAIIVDLTPPGGYTSLSQHKEDK